MKVFNPSIRDLPTSNGILIPSGDNACEIGVRVRGAEGRDGDVFFEKDYSINISEFKKCLWKCIICQE
ncbi:MAG: hypothetical protein ACI83O_000525 [Patescibacteria group bacterium]|jgi:hypothetical protein